VVRLTALRFQVGQVVRTRVSVTKQYNLVSIKEQRWTAAEKEIVAQAMRHRLQWFIYLGAHSLRKEDKHPAYTLFRLCFYLVVSNYERGIVGVTTT